MEHSKKLDLSISAADLERIERILDYHFSRPERVALALTHSSWANEHGLGQAHNERLEFLGDAVLELCISWELFTRFPQAREGDMTRVRSQLVGTTSLAQRARETGIDQLLRLGRGEEQQGGRSRDAVLSVDYIFTPPYWNVSFTLSGFPLTFLVHNHRYLSPSHYKIKVRIGTPIISLSNGRIFLFLAHLRSSSGIIYNEISSFY